MDKPLKLTLNSSVSKLQGVGTKTAQKVNKLGIKTLYDLITYFPFRYANYVDLTKKDLRTLPDKTIGTIYGTLIREPESPRRTYCKMRLQYGDNPKQLQQVTVMFFMKAWLRFKFHQGDKVIVTGTYNAQYGTISGDRITKMKHKPTVQDKLKPKYNLTKGLKQPTLRKMIIQAYKIGINQIHDTMPQSLKKKYKLEDLSMAIHDLQFPTTLKQEYLARRTFKFDELYKYEIKIQKLHQKTAKSKGISIKFNPKILRKFDNSLPFTMTSGQIRSVKQIVLNLKAPTQMNRLLQGDVGSGKTLVAAFAILATVSAGYQCALMVPTSVLAEQHAKNLSNTFKSFNVNIGLLTGETTPQEKEALIKHLKKGDINLIIGTDALIWPDVQFKNLGLVIIDEQHKFGVNQRKKLLHKNKGVNGLAMTATPIPRTLAMTTYGDMSESIIDTLPKGRKPIKTDWIKPNQFKKVVPFMKKLLNKGQQAYIVVPLVKQNEKQPDNQKLDSLTAYHVFKKLFPEFKVGLLHGQMDDDKKDKITKDFENHKFDILVSTTVIEVGMDVKNATMMVIWNSSQFGLASLHQIRGRIGRNRLPSYCWLIDKGKTEDGRKRLKIMENYTNGFIISEKDAHMRGGGDIFGQNQSGVPVFKCADVLNDTVMLSYAQAEARKAVMSRKLNR